MYTKQAKLKVLAMSCLGAAVLLASGSSHSSQHHIRQLAAVTEGSDVFDAKLRSLYAKIHSKGAADIWLINQPKCGTGYLAKVILSTSAFLGCKLYGDDESTRFFDCGNDKLFFRTHSVETASRVKTLFDLARSRNSAKAVDQCVAITAVRNPLHSIPSMFFQSWGSQLCDGSLPVEDVVKMYEQYLAGSMPARQVQTIANMLRTFSGENDFDLYQALSVLAEKGVAFFNGADQTSPWAGCELLVLQLDHDEDGRNIEESLGALFPGKVKPVSGRSELCPNAVESIEAVYQYELTDKHLDKFAETSPEMRDLFRYYMENPDPRPAQVVKE